MAVWNLFFSSILLPLVVIVLLAIRTRQPFAGWAANFALAAGVTGFSFFTAPWGLFGIYLRYLIGALFLLAVVVSLRKPDVPPEGAPPMPPESPLRMFAKIIIGAFFGAVAVGAVRARVEPPAALDLAFPLGSGTFLVAHGGGTPAANIHFNDQQQHFAVDFVRLNATGMRAHGIFPADPKDYAIFGQPVLAPCGGVVATVVDQFSDTQPDPKNPLGNQVAIQCGDAIVHVAQLERGSVTVRPGSTIAAGTPLGRAGNSGLTPEPNVHVHAERNGTAVPITFGGRWLVRNSVVRR